LFENADEAIEATKDADKLCNVTGTSMNNRVSSGGGFLNDGIRFTGYPVVGFNHRMVASGGCEDYHQKHENQSSCTPTQIIDKNQSICFWDRRARGRLTFDLEIRVPLSRAREAILDVKKIRASNPKALCALEGSGIIMRTIKKSEAAYLGPAEDVVTMEIIYSRSRQAYVPTWRMDVYQEIEQMLIENHGGTLHWGKSGGHLFQGLAEKTVNLQQFLTVKQRLDPDGLFSNEWTDGLLGIGDQKVEVLKNGCALEKLCKCREDIHCAPNAGYLCRPGRVWKNARVCRKGN
jgi:FAD-dependent oxidoreductase